VRELTQTELEQVGGASELTDAMTVGGAIGGALGVGYAQAVGATGSAVVGFAAIGAASFSGVIAVAGATYAAGQWLNANIQSWISSGLDALTGGGGGGGGRFPAYEILSDTGSDRR
jgi:hypothetical protein